MLAFDDWKQQLLDDAGSSGPPVRMLGDYVLELFWKDGCEPTVSGLLYYAESGLCRDADVVVPGEALPDLASG